jgi:hemerythrin-like domain-containing protein
MPVQIGATTHSFDDPTGMLSDCHRRVEMFMGALLSVADVCHQPLNDETRRALDLALRYFREAAPKHTADEEESLFPRLRQIANPELQIALSHLDALENDHRWAEPLHEIVDLIGNEYLAKGELTPAKARDFRDAVSQLAAMYRRHIDVEDQQVFPVAAKVVSAELKAEIAKEMAARRAVRQVVNL